jgi:hypothetical protein
VSSYFRFGGILRKYATPFYRLRSPEVTWIDGKPVPVDDGRELLKGSIQPIGAKLLQLEGGRYTMDDRVIYSVNQLEDGDVIEHQSKSYTIEGVEDRGEYSDVYKYMAKYVSPIDPGEGAEE